MKLIILAFFVSCLSFANEPTTADQYNMRHGFTIFTGPKPTKMAGADKNAISRGKIIYEKNCQKCHGPKGRGDGELAKKKGLEPTNFQQKFAFLPNQYLVIQINHGRSEMPQWKDLLTPKQTQDVSQYIQSFIKPTKK